MTVNFKGMKGTYAFCPKSGAQLSKEVHYDERGRPRRAPVCKGESFWSKPDGELTAGAVRSSRIALFNYFRQCHQDNREANQSLYRKALLEIRRLKRTATGTQEWDIWVWHALQERLAREGYETEWMHGYTRLRCPHCYAPLKYEEYTKGEVVARCGGNCTDTYGDQLPKIRETIAALYAEAFDDKEAPDPEDLLQF